MSSQIVITCVSDDAGFAREVYDYLYSELEKQKQFEEGRNLNISRDLIMQSEGEDADSEIFIDRSTLIPNGMIKWILQSFLQSDPRRFKEFDVFEIADTFTIGQVLHPSKAEEILHTCEICGFFTPYREELYTHRITHFGV